MSYSEETQYSEIECTKKKKKTWMIVTIVLFILALPVIFPISLCIAGGVLAVAIALIGGFLAILIGIAGCIAAGLICLAALLICSVIGAGFGVVMLFETPASGLAVLGMSLMGAGVGAVACLLVWQLGKICIKGMRKFVNWARLRLTTLRKVGTQQ